MTEPVRIQRRRVKGWRMPPDAIYVGRGSRWGNPYRVGEALARVPALDGSPWEPEDRISANGYEHPYFHPGGRVTRHVSRLMTVEQVVQAYRWEFERHGGIRRHGWAKAGDLEQLRGKNLACWCPLGDAQGNRVPCHADVLLELANRERP
jgi:hypothetical protein